MIKNFKEKKPLIHQTAFISEAAYVVGNVEIGENSSVWPGAVIRGDFGTVVIGRNTAVEDNCVVHTADHIEIGDNVIIGHNVTIHCKKLGNNCLVGIGAILLQGAEIGNDCFIAAGALVTPNTKVPDGSMVMGSPAKVTKQLSGDNLAMVRLGAEHYTAMAEEYRQQGL
ncbi:MAG: gamma carbonic anhydrase family protein [Dehalococcoidia bacterium]|nr:gamma carbonic anhydrase family protein [Dehalococcoidia bacterium]